MIGVVDYGAGNLQSVSNALDHLGLRWRLAEKPSDFERCDRMILPGVGHFSAAMQTLSQSGLDAQVRAFVASGKGLLGICLGAQMLLESSEESLGEAGLGLIAGDVVRLQADTVPHMGWNRVRALSSTQLLADEHRDAHYYFAHSYICKPTDEACCVGMTRLGAGEFCAAFGRGNVWGVQFHPEKSAEAGLALLGRFAQC